MSIIYATIECGETDHPEWEEAVNRWAMIRPDWKQQVELGDVNLEFAKSHFSIKIENKKDLLDVFQLFLMLNHAYPNAKIGWHQKVETCGVSLQTTNGNFRIFGGPNLDKIDSKAIEDINKIKAIIKNY